MAVIKKLLLSTGGGIISPKQQAEQVENTASIFIGLGGTGIDAIRTIKTEVYSRLKPDDSDAVVPTYKHIRFLGADTTVRSRGNVEYVKTYNSRLALDEEEFLFIGDNKLSEKLKNHDILNQIEQLEWFRHEDIVFGGVGAGARQIGRYLFMNKANDFANKLRSNIRLAKEDLDGTSLYIHLFAGLSGGTGSGVFLDACYLIKKIAPNATVFGYFFLPDINLAKISEYNDTVRAFIKRNGYAALQELDYCMQLDKNGGQFKQLYPGDLGYVDWRGAPVSLCHIIGAEGVGGRVVSNSYDYAMNVTAEYVMDFLTKVNDINFSLEQHLAICTSMMAQVNYSKEIASEVFYAVIGASCAEIPNKEINTYLASALFSKLTNVKYKLPSESDVNRIAIDAFAPTKKSVREIYDEILRDVREDAGNDYIDSPYDWQHLRDYDNSDIVTHYTDQRAAKYNAIEKNKKAMDSDINSQSLINKLYKVLNKEIVDVNKGPNYVYGVLNKGLKVNIENIIDGLISENNDRKIQELIQSDRRRKEYEEAYQECKDNLGGFFVNNRKLYNEYLFRLENVMRHEVDIEAYNAIEELLVNLKEKITSSANDYYKKLSNLFNDLLETFELNKITLDSINVQNTNDCFAEELISIHEIKDVLDKEVDKLSLDGFMSLLIQHLMKNDNEWLSGKDSKITKLVNDFFVKEVFNEFAGKAITSFLQMKYKTDKEEVIKQKIYHDWIKKLVTKSNPMFPDDTAVTSKLGGYGKVAFVSVPDTSSPIIKAAEDYQNINPMYMVKPSGLQDRIYIMSSICGMPLSAYSPLEKIENDYFGSIVYNYGLHLYEGKECDEFGLKDWRRLAPLTPISLIKDNRLESMCGLKEQIKTTEKLFALAINYGIISDTDWKIYSYSKDTKQKIHEFLKEIKLLMLEVHDAVDVEFSGIKDKISMLEDILKNGLERTGDFLPFDGNDFGIKERRYSMMFDHFICAPTYVTKVKETVELRECIEDIYKHLNKVVNDCDMLFE